MQAYSFFCIARDSHVDYGDALIFVDQERFWRGEKQMKYAMTRPQPDLPQDVKVQLVEALNVATAIRKGLVAPEGYSPSPPA